MKLERAAMQQALEALEVYEIKLNSRLCNEAITALREALDHSGEANEMVAEQAEQEPVAIDWEKAQEVLCDVWSRVISADDGFDAIQDLIYAAPVRTKDLTDDEILPIAKEIYKLEWVPDAAVRYFGLFARAVIAADRELNK